MKRTLGFWRCWALVVGSMIGNGVFMLPAVLAPYGSYSLLGWLFAGAGTLFIAFTLGGLARMLPRLGGPYAYTRAAFGRTPGFLVGWGHWISYVTATSAGAVAFTGYLAFFLPGVAEQPLVSGLVAVALIWLMTGLNLSGVQGAGVFQLVTTLLKLLPLFLVASGGFLVGDVTSIPASNPDDSSMLAMIATLVMITMWAYVGIENVTIPADDVIEPRRTIPRALIVGAITATVVYVVATLGVMALVPAEDLAVSTFPFADAAVVLFGGWGAGLIAGGAIVSIVGALNGNVLATAQLSRAIAVDRMFPALFERLNTRGVPGAGLVASGLFATVLIGMNYTRGLVGAFELLILVSTLTTLLPYACSALAALVLGRREQGADAPAPWVAVIALLFSLFAIAGSGLEVVIYGLGLLALGLPVLVLMRRQGSLDQEAG
jgi:APA family basic amino acid/polyamine antiporter